MAKCKNKTKIYIIRNRKIFTKINIENNTENLTEFIKLRPNIFN